MIASSKTYTKNDVFCICSLIEYIGRRTKNHRKDVVKALGIEGVNMILDYADVYHCQSFEQSADEVCNIFPVQGGTYDTVSNCKYKVPSCTDIGKVYQRIIFDSKKVPNAQDVIDVFTSFISDKISDFNSAVYYSSQNKPQEVVTHYRVAASWGLFNITPKENRQNKFERILLPAAFQSNATTRVAIPMAHSLVDDDFNLMQPQRLQQQTCTSDTVFYCLLCTISTHSLTIHNSQILFTTTETQPFTILFGAKQPAKRYLLAIHTVLLICIIPQIDKIINQAAAPKLDGSYYFFNNIKRKQAK